MALTAGLLTVLAVIARVKGESLNKAKISFTIRCMPNQPITMIKGVPIHGENDRSWDFNCSLAPIAPIEDRSMLCKGEGNMQGYGSSDLNVPSVLQCPGQRFLTGVTSVYDNNNEDRYIKNIECCDHSLYYMSGCIFTGWQNNGPNETLMYEVPYSKVLKGIISYFDHTIRERRYKFEVCTFGKYYK